MSEEMFQVVRFYIEERGFGFVLTRSIINLKYGTGFTVAELRTLFTHRFGGTAIRA